MTARARSVPAPFPLEPTPRARAAVSIDLLHGGPRLTHVGRYQLLDSLSSDAHGRVYDAWDPLLERGVTVKTLQFGLKMSARIAIDRQILRAARKASTLRNRSIATVLDSGLSAHGIYLVTEHLDGRDLQSAVHEGWRPSTGEIAKLGRRIADALSYAHGQGTVHGGLEPACIFLNRASHPKLLNFGLVDALRATDIEELAEVRLGALAYRSPEQLVGGPAEPHSDLFSLGSVLYELLSGRRAFDEGTPEGQLQAILSRPPTPLASLRPDLPAALIRLIESAMSFEPSNRPASASGMALTLRAVSKLPPPGHPPGAAIEDAGAPAATTAHWSRRWTIVGRLLGMGSAEPDTGPPSRARPTVSTSPRPQAQPVVAMSTAEPHSA